MPDHPPGPPDRPLDNEPTPLLTYDESTADDEPVGPAQPQRSSRRRWTLALILIALLAGGGYIAFEVMNTAPADESLELMSLPTVGPTEPMTSSNSALIAVTPIDTVVLPGSEVEIAVRAREGEGPAGDMLLRFEIEMGSTSREEEVWTDAAGVARLTVQMPARPASALVRVSSGSLDAAGPIFRIASRTGPPVALDPTGGDEQEADVGVLLPERLEVEVRDVSGVPVPGVELFFEVATGDGLTAPSRTRTDTLGRASAIWRLGSQPGSQTLVVSADELAESVTFTAIARPTETAAAGGSAGAGATTEAGPGDTPSGPPSVISRDRSIGGANVCAIQGASVTCRGANDRGQRLEGGISGSRAVAAGLFHGCALDTAGVARCWGANESGQLGDGSTTDRAAPVSVETDLRFGSIAAGLAHTCAVAASGQAVCWGANLGGQLGDGTRDDRALPDDVQQSPDLRRVVAGWNHTCGIASNGVVYCWGLNREGAVGDGTRLDRLAPTRVLDSVSDAAAGSAHTCAVRQGEALCWGANGAGQLGDGTTQAKASPTPVDDLSGPVTDVAAGAAHTCALLDDGSLYCWGQNLYGQLGNGSTAPSTTPRAVAGDLRFARVHAGGGVTCGMTSAGDEYCWGLNQSGQVGDGTRTNRAVPTRVVQGG